MNDISNTTLILDLQSMIAKAKANASPAGAFQRRLPISKSEKCVAVNPKSDLQTDRLLTHSSFSS